MEIEVKNNIPWFLGFLMVALVCVTVMALAAGCVDIDEALPHYNAHKTMEAK